MKQFSIILILFEINLLYLIWGCTHHIPYFNLHHLNLINFQKHSLQPCSTCMPAWDFTKQMNQYPVASPLLQQYNTIGLAPPPISTPDSHPTPRSAPALICRSLLTNLENQAIIPGIAISGPLSKSNCCLNIQLKRACMVSCKSVAANSACTLN